MLFDELLGFLLRMWD